MKSVSVKEECSGCGACIEICTDAFEMDDLVVLVAEAYLLEDDCIVEAAEACPVEAIEYK